jgi:putative transposase
MRTVSYSRHRFPAEIIQHAVWLYFRFPLSFRDVEDLPAQRGIDVWYETVRRWSIKFGLAYANTLRKTHPRADVRWHLDEVFVSINGKSMYLWRAVDCEGEATGSGKKAERSWTPRRSGDRLTETVAIACEATHLFRGDVGIRRSVR